jgi:Ca-activated chloride channel family protein
MSWLHLEWLWLLLPLVALLLYRLRDEEFNYTPAHTWLIASAFLLILALCRPVIEQAPVEIDMTGSDIIVAVDLSHSMHATDLEPTRLEAAKQLLAELVRSQPQDRFGVIGFTTSAVVLSPMTNDAELLLHLFNSLDENMIITKGTLLEGALKLARKMSRAERPKVLLLTDGGDAMNYNEEVVYAKTHNLQVNVVMLASRGGSTLYNSDGSLLKDEEGHIVVTARNNAVKAISSATGGTFIEGADLGAIRDVLAGQKEEAYKAKTKVMQYQELFYYFIAASIAAFMFGMTTLGAKLQRMVAALLIVAGIGANASPLDSYYIYQAQKAYEREAYEEAARMFGSIESRTARFNAANSLYKAGKYEKALETYRSIRSSDPKFKAVLFFNRANCLIRMKEYAQAREALHKSLTLHHDSQAVENLYAISLAEAQDHMLSGRQEGKKRAQQTQSQSESSQGKGKKAGGSNMDVSASSGGSGGEGEKVKTDPRLGFGKTEGMLSSRQYELINQRSVNETKPW